MRGKDISGIAADRLCGITPAHAGKSTQRYQGQIVPRITPAHAGKRYRSSKSCVFCPDYPRPCGEKDSENGKQDKN